MFGGVFSGRRLYLLSPAELNRSENALLGQLASSLRDGKAVKGLLPVSLCVSVIYACRSNPLDELCFNWEFSGRLVGKFEGSDRGGLDLNFIESIFCNKFWGWGAYSCRRATTGSMRAALIAGSNPEMTPTVARIPKAASMMAGDALKRMSPS